MPPKLEERYRELKTTVQTIDRKSACIALISLGGLLVFFTVWHFTFGAIQLHETNSTFVIPENTGVQSVGRLLEEEGFIRHQSAFDFLAKVRGITEVSPGSYALSKSQNTWQIATILSGPPKAVWVTIQEGLRKEQIGAILTQKLHWSNDQYKEWVTQDTNINWSANPPNPDPDYSEGVYFPETYLMPTDATPGEAAKRLQNEFNEKFGPLATEALRQNIKWTKVVIIASILQREAAGPEDMNVIAGIIWNRLNAKMPLDIDATLQYSRGNTGAGWWSPITPAFKKIDSPYNTYTHAGLPPTPISNPGLDALKAVLYPEKTDCLYYLHDSEGIIHCSATYQGQLKNIQKYY